MSLEVTDKPLSSTLMVLVMKATGKVNYMKAMAFSSPPTEQSTRANGKKEKSMA